MSLIGALTQAGAKAAKKAPFYSAVDEALAAVKRPKGTGAEFFTELSKQPGVKKAELADRKLEQAFKAKGKITKEEAQQVLKDNPPPKLSERELVEIDDSTRERMMDEKLETSGYDYMGEVPARRIVAWNDEIDQEMEKFSEYKTAGGENYREILLKLPEGFSDSDSSRLMSLEANQRRGELSPQQTEQLAALQAKKQSAQPNYYSTHFLQDPNVLAHMRVQDRISKTYTPDQAQNIGMRIAQSLNVADHKNLGNGSIDGAIKRGVVTPLEAAQYADFRGFRDVDKTGARQKVLHVEEIQSDWHQEGRKKGYRNEEQIQEAQRAFSDYSKDARERMRQLMLKESETEMAPDRALRFVNQYVDGMDDSAVASFLNEKPAFNALYRASRDAGATGVPDAPFKKNWHELAMKRLLNYAADNGYDSIAITPGAEQAKRYDLSKQINTISWNKQSDGLYGIEADAVNGRPIVKKGLTEQELENTVGKEVANRIVNGVGQFANDPLFDSGKLTRGRLENLDLKVGGEGMKGFYDKMLPDYLNTYGKPYGAQMGTFDIPNPKPNKGINDLAELLHQRGLTDEQYANLPQQERVQLLNEVKEANASQMIPLHNFPITPEMRESIKQKGLPLYQQVGIPTAGAGAASQALQPEEEAGLATGGIVKSAVKQAQLAKLAKMRQEMAPRAEAIKALIARDQNRYLADVVPNSLTNAEIESEIKRMAAKARAAESDAKLAKFLEESKVKDRLYHGTNKDISFYDKSKLGANPETAHQTSQLGFFLTSSPEEASAYAGKRKGANVQPLHAAIKNPYETTWDNIHEIDGYELQQKLKGLGYDGVVIKDKGAPDNYVAFEPTQIKSATGNRGTFDPLEPEVNKAKGGKVRMTKNRDTMFMELSNKKLKRK